MKESHACNFNQGMKIASRITISLNGKCLSKETQKLERQRTRPTFKLGAPVIGQDDFNQLIVNPIEIWITLPQG
jgi:hypothetical protein